MTVTLVRNDTMSFKKDDTKMFLTKKFYLHMRGVNIAKITELINTFGGQVEQFMDATVSYVLTDKSRKEWPPHTKDTILEQAIRLGIKLMSKDELESWCLDYAISPISSDDDNTKGNIRCMKQPFLKFEDVHQRFAPSFKEFGRWPDINVTQLGNLPIGRSFFSDTHLFSTPNNSTANQHPNNSAQLTQQATNSIRTNTANISITSAHTTNFHFNHQNLTSPPHNLNPLVAPNPANNKSTMNLQQIQQQQQRGVKRRHTVYCEVCCLKITDKIEEHIKTESHRINTDKVDWSEVNMVINSLPSLNLLNRKRLSTLTLPPNGIEHEEFLCLHKVESVSQLFNEDSV